VNSTHAAAAAAAAAEDPLPINKTTPTDEFTGIQKAYKCTGNGNITIIIIAEENHATTWNSKLLNPHTKDLYEAPRHVDQPHDARTAHQ
jgi:hypothetical protein